MKNFNYKLLCWVAAFFAFAYTATAQQGGPIPALATPASCGGIYTGTTVGFPVSGAPSTFCGTSISSFASGVWYVMVGTGQQVTVTTCNPGSNYDTKLHVYSGQPGGSNLSCIGGNDDMGFGNCSFSSLRSEVVFNTTPGSFYYILVSGFSSSSGTYQVSFSCQGSTLANDACSGATNINCGDVVSGSTANALADNAPFCGTSNTAKGVWYKLTGTGGIATVTTCGAGTNYDTKLTVYTGSCNGLVCVDGNDDTFGCAFGSLRSEVTFCTSPGTTYYVLVHGFSSSSGNFELSYTCAPGISNDLPCSAQAVNIGATTFSNSASCASGNGPSPGAGSGSSSCNSQDGWCSFETGVDNDVWFSFEAPASGCVSIVADGPGFDSQIAVWDIGDCNDLNTYTVLAANDDSGDDIIPGAYIFAAGIDELSCLTPGATYYIQVDGYNGDEVTNGTLTIIDCGGTPLSVDAGDCQSRFIGYAPAEADTNFLYPVATGGQAPYTYSWSPSGLFTTAAGVLADQPSVTTTYTVTVTDARGCTATDDVTINVIDVNVACATRGNPNKVQICHNPPANPRTLCVDDHAVASHLGHGDRLGPCSNTCTAINPSVPAPPACVDLDISLTTDRFPSETSWELVDVTANTVIDAVARFTYASSTTYNYSYCVDPTHCYEWRLSDSFGDGICCFYGQGGYTVSLDGNTVAVSNASTNPFGSSSRVESIGNCSNKNGSQTAPEAALEAGMDLVAYPNPSNGQANFKFRVAEAGNATIEIFDATGIRIATVFNGYVDAGRGYVVDFDGSSLASGLYIYKLTSGEAVESGKLYISK